MKFAGKNTPKENHLPDQGFREVKKSEFVNETENLLSKQKEDHVKASFAQTVFNFVKLFIGIAILTMPKVFSQCGIIEGILSIAIVFLWYSWTVVAQSDSAIKQDAEIRSLSELCLKVLGPIGYFLMNFFIMWVQIGIDIWYLMFNGAQIDQIVWQATQNSIWGYSKTYIWIVVLCIIPLMWIKHLRDLSYVSFIFLVASFVTLATISYYSIEKMITDNIQYQVNT